MPHFHFVHGAWHGPWAFDGTRAELEARGFATSASALPSVSGDGEAGMRADGAAIRAELEALAEAGEEIVLVAHSMGGNPSVNAVEGLGAQQRAAGGKRGGVVSHVFLTAFAPDVGASQLDLMGELAAPWLETSDDGRFVWPKAEMAADIFYNDVPDKAVVAAAVARLRPMAVKAFGEASGYAPWEHGFNVAYIFTEKDRAIPPELQRLLFAKFPAGSFSASMDSDHSPFLYKNKELADHLVAAYEHAAGSDGCGQAGRGSGGGIGAEGAEESG